jgi:hypothetical protein
MFVGIVLLGLQDSLWNAFDLHKAKASKASTSQKEPVFCPGCGAPVVGNKLSSWHAECQLLYLASLSKTKGQSRIKHASKVIMQYDHVNEGNYIPITRHSLRSK